MVAGSGDRPTPVTSVHALAEYVVSVGSFAGDLPSIVLQPWEGATTGSVVRDAGRKNPRHVPSFALRLGVKMGHLISSAMNEKLQGAVRRAELMWFGQDQDDTWATENGLLPERRIGSVLREAHTASGSRR